MRNVVLTPLRTALLTALGAALAGSCGGSVNSESGGSGAGSPTSSGAGNGPPGEVCAGAQPIAGKDGRDTGFARCPDGTVHRREAMACSPVIDARACDPSILDRQCNADSECSDGTNGRCIVQQYVDFGGQNVEFCGCAYACETDADCGAGQACACGGVSDELPWSSCIDARCATGAACPSNECGLSEYFDGCSTNFTLECRSDADACRLDSGCGESMVCVVPYNETWKCAGQNCAIGRPFMVEGSARSAPVRSGSGWTAACASPSVASLDPSQRAALADHWQAVAALEHASIASFARFVLQLLGVGAPAELVVMAQQAMADEVEHARIAFAIAGAYAGRSLAPASLDASQALGSSDLRSMLVGLIEEACVGETLGVAEALAAAHASSDPAVREALQRIADDEVRHAALAWRTLRWGLERADQATRAAVAEAFERACALAQDPPARPVVAPEHGLLSAAEVGAVRRQALREVVAPCALAAFRLEES